MNNGSSTRRARQSRPEMERLEGRELLSADGSGVTTLAATAVAAARLPGAGQEFDYTTPDGTRVGIRLHGVGSLAGTYVDPDGALNLRFSGTNEATQINARVHGGTRRAPLRSVQSLYAPPTTLSGVGGSLINLINLKDFDLVPGGRINLTAGVHVLFLNSVAADTQVQLREMPPALQPAAPSTPNLATPAPPAGSGLSYSTAGITGPFTENGVTLSYLSNLTGARTLTDVSGLFVPGPNLHVTNITSANPNSPPPGPPPAPPGVVVSINHVNGPVRDGRSIGNPQLFAYDKDKDQLVRFDAVTGRPTLSIPNALHGNTAGEAGVTLAHAGGKLVVLVGDGNTVYAYDPLNGAALGSFSTAPLKAPPVGLANPTRLGTYDSFTVVGDPTAGPNGLGKLQAIDVTASLATGQAVVLTDPSTGNPAVPPYVSQRGFQLTGGLAGLPGLNTLYAAGAAHFDPFQPDQFQLGVASLSPGVPSATSSGAALTETDRNPLIGNTSTGAGTIVTNAQGATVPGGNLNNAFGNVDLSLALITGKGTDPNTGLPANTVSLYNPTSFAKQRDIYLDTPDTLTALSGSFRPDLKGVALVDVQGNTQSFRARDAQGLVFNGEGNVNLVKIRAASHSTILGYPFGHAQIPARSDVTILSSGRSVGSRNGVIDVPNLQPTGPLSLP